MSVCHVMQISDGKIIISKHVLFDEYCYPCSPEQIYSVSPLVIPFISNEEGDEVNEPLSRAQEVVDETRHPENAHYVISKRKEGVDKVPSKLPVEVVK
ncbi:hypothetical protein O181_017919 [Austropuccinia psidii MF-1]|uniref:Uncharacterized protein n=1 Tax=Austropuccinia psidii MF-1 TaxID=1389203 RepID=A0A9Q3C6M8_9BASI|nr:hypothetical protein [Austropuccinia psidii MF-1]